MYVCVLFIIEAVSIVAWFLVTKVDTVSCDEATPCAEYAPFIAVAGVFLTLVMMMSVAVTVCNISRSTLNPLKDHRMCCS